MSIITINDLFDQDLFVQMREEGYIKVQTLPESVLAIANYTNKAQIEQKWNPVTLQCRGLIFDVFTGDVRCRPFPKFFNWDDSSQPYPPQSQCVIMPKVDGSLGILYSYNFKHHIATRGSFTSDQAIWATKFLQNQEVEWKPQFDPTATYLFEIVYPENRIVVDYGNEKSLTLLEVLDTETGESRFDLFEELSWPNKVDRNVTIFNDQLVHQIPEGEEGFVLLWPHQQLRVKIKSSEYLALHKLIFGLNAMGVWERIGNGETWQDICDKLPDEFHAWVKNLADEWTTELERIWLDVNQTYWYIRSKLELYYPRKAFAMWAKAYPIKQYLFMMEDKRTPEEIKGAIWKTLRPSGVDQIKAISEDVA